MEAYLLEWLNLIGRWAHMITGIAWIGASFYFIWLDNHLQPPAQPADRDKGVGGEVWSVHGGGFYHAQKYVVAPAALPETLHWFKWEAYTTWLTGMFMLGLVYYWGAEVALIDPLVADLAQWQAIGIGLAFIAGGWIAYDLLCRSPLGQDELLLGIVLFLLTSAAAWALCQIFSGRGAFIHYGSMLGTIMVFNVFFVIIPGQAELVKAKQQGRTPDPVHGLRGRQRSVHNTYFTLPVLFTMIANHYAFVTGHAWNWAILIALAFAGAMIRLWFVLRHKGSPSPLPLAAGLVMLVVLALLLSPRGDNETVVGAAEIDFPRVAQIVAERCTPCHAARPAREGFAAPPKGVMLETPAQMRAYASAVLQQSVTAKAMPPGNMTEMTDAERELVRRWVRAGAPVR